MELMGIADAKLFNECYRQTTKADLDAALYDVRRRSDDDLERVA